MRAYHAAAALLALQLLASPGALSAEQEQETASGFRMEGDSKIETVFGDTTQYKRYVDRFMIMFDEMQTTRDSFSRNVQGIQASLEAHKHASKGGVGKCPTDAIALSYTRAQRFGERYHRLGKELEANYVSIHELDTLGETSGLTPDYRWKVARALKLYPQSLRDFREMKLAFQEELAADLAVHGCSTSALVATGEELEKAGATEDKPLVIDKTVKKPKRGKPDVAIVVPATTITFFVDNSSCTTTLKVFVDGTLEGEIGSHAKAAFRALAGRHEMCLIPSSSKLECGMQGTIRKTYVHDGWSIQLRCD